MEQSKKLVVYYDDMGVSIRDIESKVITALKYGKTQGVTTLSIQASHPYMEVTENMLNQILIYLWLRYKHAKYLPFVELIMPEKGVDVLEKTKVVSFYPTWLSNELLGSESGEEKGVHTGLKYKDTYNYFSLFVELGLTHIDLIVRLNVPSVSEVWFEEQVRKNINKVFEYGMVAKVSIAELDITQLANGLDYEKQWNMMLYVDEFKEMEKSKILLVHQMCKKLNSIFKVCKSTKVHTVNLPCNSVYVKGAVVSEVRKILQDVVGVAQVVAHNFVNDTVMFSTNRMQVWVHIEYPEPNMCNNDVYLYNTGGLVYKGVYLM